MSTFDGIIKEYPLISIDSFLETKNFPSTAYFLSHCHTDHMNGLATERFFNHLKSRNFSKIYLSDVSNHLLKNDCKYQHLADFLVVLPIEQPTIIILYNEDGQIHSRVVVTLLTAGHCPGSVMFLIEGGHGRVLYTGDFRLPIGSSARLTHMHEYDGSLKSLESLYIDTTFCNKKCLFIPSREECLTAIVSLVEPWIFKGPNYIVCFFCPAQYAYEFVFVELYKRFGVKTHVTAEKQNKYIGIKIIEDAVTSCSPEARIHACALEDSDIFQNDVYNEQTPCGYFSPDKKPIRILKIKPSAMFFQRQDFTDISRYDYRSKMYRVCYSTHSSLSEIRDMVSYLRPKEVFPNVVHKQTEKEILDLIYKTEVSSSPETTLEDCNLPLGQLKSPQIMEFSEDGDSLPFYDECYKINKEQKNLTHSSKDISRISKNLFTDTDFKNTEEQQIILRKEIFSQQKKVGENSKFECKLSPLKWQNPVVSSEDEVSEHSFPLESPVKYKLNSNLNCGTSVKNKPMSLNKELHDKEIPVLSQLSINKAVVSPAHTSVITSSFLSKNDNSITNDDQYLKDNSLRFSSESSASQKSSSSLVPDYYNFPSTSKQSHVLKSTKRPSSSNVPNCRTKFFRFVKRINSLGDEEIEEDDERTFKHVVKLKKSDGSSSDSDGEYAFKYITKLPKQRKKNVIRPTVPAVTKQNISSNCALSFQEDHAKFSFKANSSLNHSPRINFSKKGNVTNTDLVNSKFNENMCKKELKISCQNEIKSSKTPCENSGKNMCGINHDLINKQQMTSKESEFSTCKPENNSELKASSSHIWATENVTTKILNQPMMPEKLEFSSLKPQSMILQTMPNYSQISTTENVATKLNQPGCSNTQNIYEKLFLTSSDEMDGPCSLDQSPPKNEVHSSINDSCVNKLLINDAPKSAVDSWRRNEETYTINANVRSDHLLRTNLENPLFKSSDEINVPCCINKNLSTKNNVYSSSNKYCSSKIYVNNTHESVVQLVDSSTTEFTSKDIQSRNDNIRANHQTESEELKLSKCRTECESRLQTSPVYNYIDKNVSAISHQPQEIYKNHRSVTEFNNKEIQVGDDNLNINNQVQSEESNLSECISKCGSKFQTLPVCNFTDKSISSDLSQSQKFCSSQDIFEELLCPSSDEIISSSVPCNKNSDSTQVNKTYSSSNKNSVSELSVNSAHNSDAECIDLVSDTSNEAICSLESSLPTTRKISTNMGIKSKNAEISFIKSSCSSVCSTKPEKHLLTEIDFPKCISMDLKPPPISNTHRFVTCQKSGLQSTSKIIISSTSPKKTAAISSKACEETSTLYINKACASSENNGTTWNTRSVNQTTNPHVVEDNLSSDSDDSPSLIAPILKVSKVAEADGSSHSSNNTILYPKRRKIDCKNHFNFTERFDILAKNREMCDRHLRGSDSTPEDLIENCNLLANSISFKRKIPEIIIEDD